MSNTNRSFQRKSRQYRLLLIGMIVLAYSNCYGQQSTSNAQPTSNNTRKLLLRDEGMSQLSYIDLANPAANWYTPIPTGRDMQLVGNGRVLVGTGSGYEEREITTGKKIFELTAFPGTVAARRLRNGNTLLSGVNWQGKRGIVLVEVDSSGTVKRTIVYAGFDYVRLVRETPSGNFLVTADNIAFEGDASGAIVWKVTIAGLDKPHAWQALRLANGQTIVSTGYAKNFQVFSADQQLVDSITGPADVNPNFYAGFQVLPNGNYIVANWQGHGPKFGASGVQVLEYTPKGKLAWSWKQDAAKFSSLHAVIVLDGLDLNALHVEDKNGMLAPVKVN
ncbi:MAG: hypothetical protein JWP81_845 [Ferruginibacter sp.]|nr:hypothetical protein [Ferruginibacter sp.]